MLLLFAGATVTRSKGSATCSFELLLNTTCGADQVKTVSPLAAPLPGARAQTCPSSPPLEMDRPSIARLVPLLLPPCHCCCCPPPHMSTPLLWARARGQLVTNTSAECCASCEAEPGCHAFRWNARQASDPAGTCTLSDRPGSQGPTPDYACGFQRDVPPGPECSVCMRLFPDILCTGNTPLKDTFTNTSAACCALCQVGSPP